MEEKKFEGKWIKSKSDCIWFIEEVINETTQRSYGFNGSGNFVGSSRRNSEDMTLADLDKVLRFCKYEAIDRGFPKDFQDKLYLDGGNLHLTDQIIIMKGDVWSSNLKSLEFNVEPIYEIY